MKFIAEFCQNHNGDAVLLHEMACAAKEAGATYGKIQTIFASDLSRRERFENGMVENGVVKVIKRPYAPEYERLKRLELNYDQQARFVESSKKLGLIPLTTCFSRGQVKRIAELDWDVIKIASYDCASLPLLKDLVPHFKKMIVSTGATYDHEITETAHFLKTNGVEFIFLHCVTLYPTPLNQLHLSRLEFLRSLTSVVGFSDHSLTAKDGVTGAKVAVHLGAECVERHFSILPPDQSRDGPVSIGPKELAELVEFSGWDFAKQADYLNREVPAWRECLGDKNRQLSSAELLNRDYYRGRFVTYTHDSVLENF